MVKIALAMIKIVVISGLLTPRNGIQVNELNNRPIQVIAPPATHDKMVVEHRQLRLQVPVGEHHNIRGRKPMTRTITKVVVLATAW
jgi:hypothetical protein